MPSVHSASIDRLFDGILKLSTREECYAFFEDLCTVNEIKDMAQRLDTAFLLKSGVNYQGISKDVGISTATISRVSRCLNYGSGGYNLVINRLKEEQTASEENKHED